MSVLRVVIADDHPVVRQGLQALLATVTDVEVVSEATNGEDAVRAAIELLPDVVVMDLSMPGLNGIEATRQIAAAAPSVGVLVLTMVEDDDSVFAALRAGAMGYVLKGADPVEVIRAIQAIAAGEVLLGASIARRMAGYFGQAGPAPSTGSAFPHLTAREREVLDLLAGGLSNQAIARRLVVNEKTVRNHVSNVFAKLHVANRAEAIVRAREAGLGSTQPPHRSPPP